MNKITRTIKSTHIGRAAFMVALMSLAMFALAACGGATTTSDSAATAQPTQAAVSVVETPTVSGDMEDMEDMPTAPPAQSTTVPVAVQTAAPTQGTMGQGGSGTELGIEADIQATLKEWSLTLSQGEVAAGKIRFTVTNEGQFAHNLSVTDSSGELAATPTFSRADGVQTLEVDLKPGTYTIICNLRGHAARGQTAQLVVK